MKHDIHETNNEKTLYILMNMSNFSNEEIDFLTRWLQFYIGTTNFQLIIFYING
jgi:hypothetical protein